MKTYSIITIISLPLLLLFLILAKGYGIDTHIGKTMWMDILCTTFMLNLIIWLSILLKKYL